MGSTAIDHRNKGHTVQNPNLQTVSEEIGRDTDVTAWALPEGTIARLGRGRVDSLELSPDGTLLASDSFDGTILLWDIKPYLSSIDTTSELSQ